MAIPEPTGALWTAVKGISDPWPPDDEDAALALAQSWRRGGELTVRMGADTTAVSGMFAGAWQDGAGATATAHTARVAQQAAELGPPIARAAGAAQRYGTVLSQTKSDISTVIAANEASYLAMSSPALGPLGPAMRQAFATKLATGLQAMVAARAAALNGSAGPVPAGGDGGPTPVDDARSQFFDTPPPPGFQRQVVKTNGIVPGGKDGIIVTRFYIPQKLAGGGLLYGDDRGPSTALNASSRVVVAWDTRTGEVSFTVAPSTATEYGPAGDSDGYTEGPWGPVINRTGKTVETPALPINPPGGGPNSFVVDDSDPSHVTVSYRLLNSVTPVGDVEGTIDMSVGQNDIAIAQRGDDYPAMEFNQYKDDGARMLGEKPMAWGREVVPLIGLDDNEIWHAPR